MKSNAMTIRQAKILGRDDGIDAVNCLVEEDGIDHLRSAVAPGSCSWDETAINAGAFELTCSNMALTGSDGARDAYYRAYEKAATERAAEILRAS